MTSALDMLARPQVLAPPAAGPLRVVYVIDKLGLGGAQTHLGGLLLSLDRTRFKPFVVCLVRGGVTAERLREGGIQVKVLGLQRIYGVAAARSFLSLVAWLKEVQPHVVHTYLSSANIFGAAAARVAGVPRLLTTRRDTGFGDGRLMSRALRATNRWATRVVAVSENVAHIVREREGIQESLLTVVPNAVDIARFAPHGRRSEARAALSLPEGAILAVTITHLTAVKGVDVLVEAAARVRSALPQVVFAVVGSGEPKAIARRAQELGLGGSFRLLGERSDVPEILEAADLFVLPSRSEGQPNALLEAMAMGLPVVATRVGGVPELVEEDREAVLVEPGSPEALARGCLQVLTAPDRGARLGRAGQERVRRERALPSMTRRYESLYEQVLAPKRAARKEAVLRRGNLRLLHLQSPAAWDGVADAWEEAAQREKEFCLGHAWLRSWWDTYGEGRLALGTVWQEDKLIAFTPWCRKRRWRWGLPVREVTNLFNPHAASSGVALGSPESECLDLLLEDLDREAWDVLVLDETPVGSQLLLHLPAACRRRGLRFYTRPSLRSPFVIIKGDWESYLEGRSGRFRKDLRKKASRLADSGLQARFDCARTPEEVQRVLGEVMTLAARSWSGQRGSSIATPPQRGFYEAIIEKLTARGWLHIWTLRLDGRLAAFTIHVTSARRVSAIKACYDPEFADLAPGSILDAHVMESLFRSGEFERYDLLGKAEFYKLRWTEQAVEQVTTFVFNRRLRSRALEALEFGLRPRLGRVKAWLRTLAGREAREAE